MRVTRTEHRFDQSFPVDLFAHALRKQLHVPVAEAAETHRFMIERPDIILNPHDMRFGFRINRPQLCHPFTPHRGKRTSAMFGFGAVMADDNTKPRHLFAVIAAAVTVADSDPGVERIDDAELVQSLLHLHQLHLVGFGPGDIGGPVGKVLSILIITSSILNCGANSASSVSSSSKRHGGSVRCNAYQAAGVVESISTVLSMLGFVKYLGSGISKQVILIEPECCRVDRITGRRATGI